MKTITKHIAGMMLIMWSASSQAMTVWAVESGQDPFSNSQQTLTLSAGTTNLDLYYDVEGAFLNVKINAAGIADKDFTSDLINRGEEIAQKTKDCRDAIIKTVEQKIREL